MAHQLETLADGSVAFATARVPAWHRLGTVTPEGMTAQEVMSYAHLGGWNVRTEPLAALIPSGICQECQQKESKKHKEWCQTGDDSEAATGDRLVTRDDTTSLIEVPGGFATIRNNPGTGAPEALGTVGPGYTPIQNEQHCELLDSIVDTSGAHFETAGSLRGGREVFVTMKLPEGIRVGGVDDVDLYLAGLNAHDGSRAFRVLTTPVRVVCANTQSAAFRDHASSHTIRHTVGSTARIQEAREALRLTFDYRDAFAEEAEKMINQELTLADFEKVCREIWPKPVEGANARILETDDRRMGELFNLFQSADTQENIRGTRWSGYQAVVEYADHFVPVPDDSTADQTRAERTLAGTYDQAKRQAFELLTVA